MKKSRKNILELCLAAAVVFTLASFSLVSKAKLYIPSGTYKVGTFGVELTDSARLEDATAAPDDRRRLLVQFWYPAAAETTGEPAPYHTHPEQFNHDIQHLYSIPALLTSKLSESTTNAFLKAKPAADMAQYPVLIFSHGMNGSRFQSTFQMEELASQGYIVVSIEHTFTASGTVLGDGTKGATIPFARMKDFSFADKLITRWSDDQIFVIDYLEQLKPTDAAGLLAGRLDMDRLGLFGHSFGGATAAATLTRDSRPKAGINLDGFYFGQYYKQGFSQPFLEIRSEAKPAAEMKDKELAKEWDMTREYYQFLMFDEWHRRIEMYANNGYESMVIKGSNHMSFSDFPLIMPLKWLLAKDTENHHRQTNQATLSFFNKHLGLATVSR